MSTDITGIARIIAGVETFKEVPYRVGVVEKNGRRRLVGGTIEVTQAVISALHREPQCAIELSSVLGWFGFVVSDVTRREIKLTGWIGPSNSAVWQE